MSINKKFLPVIALGAMVFALSTAAFGQTPPSGNRLQMSFYGMHFIGSGQTARITVQNPRISDSEIILCVRVTIVFDVYITDGGTANILRFARRVSREVLLDGGEAASFDFSVPRTNPGEYVSPMIFARDEEDEVPANCLRVVSTAAVREFGRTILNLPAVQKGFDPQPDPPASRTQ